MAPSRFLLQYYSIMGESFLLGVYAVLVLFICWIIKTRRSRMPTTHKVLFGASIMMWFLAAAHFALLMQEATAGAVRPTRPAGQALILLSVFQFVIGDLILIWRVWVIWNRRYSIAVVPLCLMIASAGLTIDLSTAPEDHEFFFSTVPVVLIVVNTCLCTSLIGGRIWYLRYRLRKIVGGPMAAKPSRSFTGAVALLIESGTFYAASQLVSLILYYVKSNGLSVMLNLEMPLIGILPTLIIVLVHFQMVHEAEASPSSDPGMRFRHQTKVTLDTVMSEDTTLTSATMSSKSTQVDTLTFELDQRCDGPNLV